MKPEKEREIAAAARRAAVRIANSGVFFSRTKVRAQQSPTEPDDEGPEKGEAVKSQKT